MKSNKAVIAGLGVLLVLVGGMPSLALAAKKKAVSASSSAVKITNVVRVHGNAFVPENASMLLPGGGINRGWGVNYLAPEGTRTWFHVPIPSIANGENGEARLKKVFLLFRSDKSIITDIHLWDGARQIKSFQKLHLSGDLGSNVVYKNQFILAVPERITAGLGISVGVSFNKDGMINEKGVGEILFVGAGAVFDN